MTQKFFKNKLFFAVMILFLVIFFAFILSVAEDRRFVMTMDDLPKGAVFVPHDHDVEEAKLVGGIAMRHYATKEAIANGGPIYGTMGYRIVAIEYIIPGDKVSGNAVGKDFPGWPLSLDGNDNLKYDHFHIAFHKDGHEHSSEELKPHNDHGTYSIHFMFLPHAEELEYGLVCGG